jgi:hypothetical protein
MDFYEATGHYIPQESTHKNLFSKFPAGKSGVIPRTPAYGLHGQMEVQFKDQHIVTHSLKG